MQWPQGAIRNASGAVFLCGPGLFTSEAGKTSHRASIRVAPPPPPEVFRRPLPASGLRLGKWF